MRWIAIAMTGVLVAGCSPPSVVTTSVTTSTTAPATTPTSEPDRQAGTIRLLFAGDIMVGRGVEPIALAEGPGLFEGIRYVVSSADLALGNLESPLTALPHLSDNPNHLEADPELARVIAGAGFDLLSVANNHSGDAGPGGLLDTIDALTAASVGALGAGADIAEAAQPTIIDVDSIRVALLAFDVTGLGLAATPTKPGVASYTTEIARTAVEAARAGADIVAVSVHGGIEYLPETDPILERVGADLVGWGADIVWGHGAHVPQGVSVITGDHNALVATSLGNLIFDQQRSATQTGLLLEVLVGHHGPVAYRVGSTDHSGLRVRFEGWEDPTGSAAYLEGSWWTLIGRPRHEETADLSISEFPWGDVIAAGRGDVTGDGEEELVVSYRHPFRPTEVNQLFPDHDFVDSRGRSAHLGVFDPDTLEPQWGAGTMLAPVAALAVCDGSVSLAFDDLDDETIRATGAWMWSGFGFATAKPLAGIGVPTCGDLDGDGDDEPMILDR